MRNAIKMILAAGLLLAGGAAFGQAVPAAAANLTFEVASVKPSAPLDMQKLAAEVQAGKMPNFGMHLDGLRAEFLHVQRGGRLDRRHLKREIRCSSGNCLPKRRTAGH